MFTFPKLSKKVLPEIRPLNLDAKSYEQLFSEGLPSHLGITLVVILDENTEGDEKLLAAYRLAAARSVLSELSEYDSFRNEFLPRGVQRVSFHATPFEVSPDVWSDNSQALFFWCSNGTAIQVAFFDGDAPIVDDHHADMAIAMAHLDSWIHDTNSLRPSDHQPRPASPEFAQMYDDAIGKLFKPGQAKWSEELARFRSMLLVAFKASIEQTPIVQEMRAFMGGPRRFHFDP